MPGQRKLFITHAGELALLLVRAVSRAGLVERFVRSYAERFGRRGLTATPARLREIESTIGREALLLLAVDLQHRVPAAFAQRRGAALSRDEAALADAFYAEFLASLGRAMDWPSSDSAERATFARDFEMYRQWSGRPAARPPAAHPGEGPFADRCALLLDPAMMEQARRAAAEFELELVQAGARTFSQLGRRGSSGKQERRKPARVSRPRPSRTRSVTRRRSAPSKKHKRAAPAKRTRAAARSRKTTKPCKTAKRRR